MNSFKNAWKEEYKRKGIPSSFRKDPTRVLVEFISWLRKENHPLHGIAADIGCGQGRNSFYLASLGFQVQGMELLEENAHLINAQAKSEHLPIQAFATDASEPWPIASGSLDIAVDIFCYKHIVDKTRQKTYRNELWRSLKPSGFYFVSLASEKDGFYGPLIKDSTNPAVKLIVDPHSQIPSFLYSIDDLTREFSDLFTLIHIVEQCSTSPMYGQEYPRVVLNAIFAKKAGSG